MLDSWWWDGTLPWISFSVKWHSQQSNNIPNSSNIRNSILIPETWTSLICVSSPKCVYMCVKRCPSQTPNAFICVSPNAFICVSPNASAESATELASDTYLCSLRFFFPSQCFMEVERDTQGKSVSQQEKCVAATQSGTARPGWRHHRNTSCDGGVAPSAAGAPRMFNREHANARAVAQDNNAAHLDRHAHSALCRRICGSGLALASARRRRNATFRQTTGPQSRQRAPPNVHEPGDPPVLGVLSFWRLAVANATPSVWAAPRRAVPSARTGETRVSRASCTPPNRGSPSTTTSSLRPSRACCGTAKSRSLTMTLVVTRAPASHFGWKKQSKLEFLTKECSCLNTDSCLNPILV